MKGFLADLYLRPSCYHCKYSRLTRVADITLGDFWGIWDYQPEWDSDKGVSALLVSSLKARNFLAGVGAFYHILLDLMKIGGRAKSKGKTYALWEASVGPFDSANLGKVRNHLTNADAVFPREEISFKYLQSIGMADEKNHLVADPAFWMQPEDALLPIEKNPKKLLIGLNVSPLSVNHSFADNPFGTKNIFTALDSLLKQNPHYRFLCIPHVMADNGGPQDDYAFMQSYWNFSEFKDRVKLLKFGLGARKTKKIISQCDLLIASRMHCCVAGISSATPTLFLTYSQKGIGMAQYAYGDLSMTLPVHEITGKSLNLKVARIENVLNHYKDHLLAQQNRFRNDAAIGIIELRKLYAKKK